MVVPQPHSFVQCAFMLAPKEVCLFFQKAGWCKFGDQCKHIHEGRASVPAPGLETAHVGSCAVPAPGLEGVAMSSGEVCKFFTKAGWCRYGNSCKHAHLGGGSISAPLPPSQPEICMFFSKNGWCKFGEFCKHTHVGWRNASMLAPIGSGITPAQQEVCLFFQKNRLVQIW